MGIHANCPSLHCKQNRSHQTSAACYHFGVLALTEVVKVSRYRQFAYPFLSMNFCAPLRMMLAKAGKLLLAFWKQPKISCCWVAVILNLPVNELPESRPVEFCITARQCCENEAFAQFEKSDCNSWRVCSVCNTLMRSGRYSVSTNL